MRVLCLGDSIMQYNDFSTFPQTGWVQELARFFPADTVWLNFARNGRSTKSFIDEGRFMSAMAWAESGDFAMIQFGHNDEKDDPARHTDPGKDGAFRKNLSYFVRELRSKGVKPILLTPMARRMFEDDKPKNSHGEYAAAIIETAVAESVPCIDMNALTLDFLAQKGFEGSRRFYMNFDSNEYENFPQGRGDNSHLRPEGANAFSKIAACEIKKIAEKFPEYKEFSDSCMENTGGRFLEVDEAFMKEANAEIDDEYTVYGRLL
ncbi:rhamnogalacturonan acetylesterase [uncultured Treponema sp.]|uniref:rhamnogalacturonan acetylesterase n=1 Tax=uncultured Treponema sp. TaxID=162155 RepID=UPI0025FE3644|nr:rhamnogalacturonan acetylesterase [uncultured Treponema sp.]